MLRFLLLLCSLIFIPSSAFAYIDPGLGSMIIQGLVAAFLACSAFMYTTKQNIKNRIKNLKKYFLRIFKKKKN